MKIKISLILFVLSLFLFDNCTKCPACQPPPLEVGFRIVDLRTSVDLVYSKRYNLDSIQVYYIENNNKLKVDIFSQVDTINKKVKIVPSGWCEKSIEGIKEFYLHLNSSETDTIGLDIIEQNECCTRQQIRRFEINGVSLKELDDMNGFIRLYEK